MCAQVAQDDLFAVEDSGRQSRTSWATQTGRDYLDEELRYDRNTGAITPAPRDGSFSPTTERQLMTPDPLADEAMTTPGTADYFSTPAVHVQQQQQQQHPLRDAVQARRALVYMFVISTVYHSVLYDVGNLV